MALALNFTNAVCSSVNITVCEFLIALARALVTLIVLCGQWGIKGVDAMDVGQWSCERLVVVDINLLLDFGEKVWICV